MSPEDMRLLLVGALAVAAIAVAIVGTRGPRW